jgi:3'-phosphoadenosine 5'-phosphosulfate sulfotransferase (PAPS reductase)/FAD synthetase
MADNVRHVLGISGGKDSAALAVFLKSNYPSLAIDYYFCDTGKELDETYLLIERLEGYLGKTITRLEAAAESHEAPFDHFLKVYGGFLPSSTARWCTKKLKLEPFERFVGTTPTISYVGIRGDEDREGYISHKANIQSIFPFRRNIWSEEIIRKVLANDNIERLLSCYDDLGSLTTNRRALIERPLSSAYAMATKLNTLLREGTKEFNHATFISLRGSSCPVGNLESFPLLDDEHNLGREDIFHLLADSGVGIPEYYKPAAFATDTTEGTYSRSRSGCYFCFFQQKIEWVWLYEQHPDLFNKAMQYEVNGYSWQDERLIDLIRPERLQQIKEDYSKKMVAHNTSSSSLVLNIITDAEEEGCAACFI